MILPDFDYRARPEARLEVPQAELDAILDRVSKVGLEGLTQAERAALDRASEALRDRDR